MTWVMVRCIRCEATKWVLLEPCQKHGFPVCTRYFGLFNRCPDSPMVLAGQVAA